jgi:tRNA uridine 5-carboxymethylaminomethyl modification enzyme
MNFSTGFSVCFFLSGTPPRIDKRTIDYTNLKIWEGDNPPIPFSFMNDRVWINVSVIDWNYSN